MPKNPKPASTVTLADLPAIGADLDGGTFAGLTTKPDGTHCAVVLLPDRSTDLTWAKAMAWAKKAGGELPTRPVAALIFANIKDRPQSGWHWTNEELNASCAWLCVFHDGYQYGTLRSFEGSAVAVRLIPLSA